MAQMEKAKLFMNGRSQAVRIPLAYRFKTDEVYIRRDEKTGDVILSQKPQSLEEVYALLDAAEIPADFMEDRDRSLPQERDWF
jgi:antitoxin VapB